MQTTPPNRRRRWFQFSLRTLLILMTAISLLLGWFFNRLRHSHEQRDAIASVRADGGAIWYADQFDKYGAIDNKSEPSGPKWLREWLGDDFFRTPHAFADSDDPFARMSGLPSGRDPLGATVVDSGPSCAKALGQLTTLKRMKVADGSILAKGSLLDDQAFAVIAKLDQLEELDLRGLNFSETHFRRLAEILNRPRRQRLKILQMTSLSEATNCLCRYPLAGLQQLKIAGRPHVVEGLSEIDLRRAQCQSLSGIRVTALSWPVIQQYTCQAFAEDSQRDRLFQEYLDGLSFFPFSPELIFNGDDFRVDSGREPVKELRFNKLSDWDLLRLSCISEFEYSIVLGRELSHFEQIALAEIRSSASRRLEPRLVVIDSLARLHRALPNCQIEY